MVGNMQNNNMHWYMQSIPWRSKRVRSYIYLNLKFHDYSSFFTAFYVANNNIPGLGALAGEFCKFWKIK